MEVVKTRDKINDMFDKCEDKVNDKGNPCNWPGSKCKLSNTYEKLSGARIEDVRLDD